MKEVKKLIQMARIKTCEECGLTKLRRCPDCGCFMDAKTRIMGAKCPQDKWSAVTDADLITIHNTLAEEGGA